MNCFGFDYIVYFWSCVIVGFSIDLFFRNNLKTSLLDSTYYGYPTCYWHTAFPLPGSWLEIRVAIGYQGIRRVVLDDLNCRSRSRRAFTCGSPQIAHLLSLGQGTVILVRGGARLRWFEWRSRVGKANNGLEKGCFKSCRFVNVNETKTE